MNNKVAPLAPFHRLPPELVEEVLLHCVGRHPRARRSRSSTTLDASKSPWIYGHICHQWRTSLLSMSHVWSDLRLLHEDIGRFSVDMLHTILQRSNMRNLVVFFNFPSGYDLKKRSDAVRAEDICYQLLELLTDESPRWFNITLFIPRSAISRLSRVAGRLASLERLYIYIFHSREEIDGRLVTVDAFHEAPNLRAVSLVNLNVLPSLPWTQLTQYTESSCGWDSCTVAQKLTNVIEFELEQRITWDTFDAPPAQPPAQLVTLEHVKLLKLRCFDTKLWHILVLPGLREVDTMAEPIAIEALTLVIRRSSCCLTHLRLLRIAKASSYITTFLYSIPTLTDLSLVSPVDFPACLSLMHLTPDSSSEILLPNLTNLAVYANDGHWNINWLKEIIRSRWSLPEEFQGSVARLTSCSISFDLSNMFGANLTIVGSIKDLEEFREQGMQITTREVDYSKYSEKSSTFGFVALPLSRLASCIIA